MSENLRFRKVDEKLATADLEYEHNGDVGRDTGLAHDMHPVLFTSYEAESTLTFIRIALTTFAVRHRKLISKLIKKHSHS